MPKIKEEDVKQKKLSSFFGTISKGSVDTNNRKVNSGDLYNGYKHVSYIEYFVIFDRFKFLNTD